MKKSETVSTILENSLTERNIRSSKREALLVSTILENSLTES